VAKHQVDPDNLEASWAYYAVCDDCDFREMTVDGDKIPFDIRFHALVEEHSVVVTRCRLSDEYTEITYLPYLKWWHKLIKWFKETIYGIST